jgi:aryl-alcohol dehydrogenase-like predicted oxidoreductase
MEQRPLGAAGPVVSKFGLGAMMFGGAADEKVSGEMLDAFVEAGGTFVDTADVYNSGVSEQWLGSWLKNRSGVRDRMVLATKGRFMVDGQPGASLTPTYLRTALEASLRRLGAERIDLYQLHGPDADHPLDEVVQFLTEAASAGKVGCVGVSNFAGWQVAKLARLLAEHNGPPLVSQQIQYSLLVREVEWEILPAAIDAGVGTLCWGPLGQGYLTGKYRRDQQPTAGTRVGESPDDVLEAWTRRNTDRVWTIVDGLRDVADGLGVTPAQAALSWVADRPGVTAPIVGARHADQLRETLSAADLRLDPAARERLDALSAPPAADYPYPYLAEISHWHN